MKNNKKRLKLSLTTQILLATAAGIIFGSVVGPWAGNLKFIGDIFLRLIQMSVVLLVMSSVAAAVGGGDGRICCDYVVMSQQRIANRVKVILVGERLGY